MTTTINSINPRTGEPVKQGDLRVRCNINMMHISIFYYVGNVEEAIRVIDSEANKQLKSEDIHTNVFGLEVFDADGDQEWSEWYNDMGEDIMQYKDELEEQEGEN